MNNFPTQENVQALKMRYPKGTRVELVRLDDPYTNLKPGVLGTVDIIDDAGTIFCLWDNGATLGVAYGEDEIACVDKEDVQ
jgi:hypothetical protein